MKTQHPKHTKHSRMVHCVSMWLILAVSGGMVAAQDVGQANSLDLSPSSAQSGHADTEPAVLGAAFAQAEPPGMEGQEGLHSASLVASSTDDPNWIDGSVQLASFRAPSETGYVRPNGFRVGSISMVPYGRLWADMIYSSNRAHPGDFILWIDSAEAEGEDTFVIDARRSRVGIDVQGPEVDVFGGMTGGGKVEIDFYGTFPNQNQTNLRLRHVYWEAKNEYLRLLAGQTWDVTSPLLPNTVNFSVGWGVGNIGYRRTQFRLERYLHFSDDVKLSLQGALAQNIIPDLSNVAGVDRETGDWPMVQARTALTFPALWQQQWTLGCSGHIGETGFDFERPSPGPLQLPAEDDARFDSWSVNADFNLPFTDRLGFHGEVFTGSNLSNLLGGIIQGIGPCTRSPIRSTGGWGEIWYDWNSCITSNVGVGIDDPDNDDSLVGRTYNRVIYSNVWVQLTNDLRTGFEVSAWRTSYHNRTLGTDNPVAGPTLAGESTSMDWTVMYEF